MKRIMWYLLGALTGWFVISMAAFAGGVALTAGGAIVTCLWPLLMVAGLIWFVISLCRKT